MKPISEKHGFLGWSFTAASANTICDFINYSASMSHTGYSSCVIGSQVEIQMIACTLVLTHCGSMTPYRNRHLGQYWSRPVTDWYWPITLHYGDVIMGAIASQITSLTIVYSTVYSDADQRKHQNSTSLAFAQGIHLGQRWIPRTNGQLRGKCSHLMMSSWNQSWLISYGWYYIIYFIRCLFFILKRLHIHAEIYFRVSIPAAELYTPFPNITFINSRAPFE